MDAEARPATAISAAIVCLSLRQAEKETLAAFCGRVPDAARSHVLIRRMQRFATFASCRCLLRFAALCWTKGYENGNVPDGDPDGADGSSGNGHPNRFLATFVLRRRIRSGFTFAGTVDPRTSAQRCAWATGTRPHTDNQIARPILPRLVCKRPSALNHYVARRLSSYHTAEGLR
jgi:hypothetical protein